MTRNEYAEIIERMNMEYLNVMNSEEYRIGKRVLKVIAAIKKRKVSALTGYIKNVVVQKKAAGISGKENVKEFEYAKGKYTQNAKGIVYTCITDGYDSPLVPYIKAEDLKYVLISDRTYPALKVWEQMDIETLRIEEKGVYRNRYCKMHPHELFSGLADFAVYIDGNVQVISELSPLYDVAKKSKCGIAMHSHRARENVYDEAKACITYRRGNPDKIRQQIERYQKEHFPSKFPLFEATVIVVDLRNKNAKIIMDAWWKEFNRSKSKRDQLSFPYVIWKLGYSGKDVGCLGTDVKLNPKFRIAGWKNHVM